MKNRMALPNKNSGDTLTKQSDESDGVCKQRVEKVASGDQFFKIMQRVTKVTVFFQYYIYS